MDDDIDDDAQDDNLPTKETQVASGKTKRVREHADKASWHRTRTEGFKKDRRKGFGSGATGS